jgi:transcriptional regulator with XRE-family HTH domain
MAYKHKLGAASPGAALRLLRVALGLRQRDVARSVGCSQPLLSQLEHDLAPNSAYAQPVRQALLRLAARRKGARP